VVGESKLPTSPFRFLVVSASKDLGAADTTIGGEKVAGVAFHREPPGSANAATTRADDRSLCARFWLMNSSSGSNLGGAILGRPMRAVPPLLPITAAAPLWSGPVCLIQRKRDDRPGPGLLSSAPRCQSGAKL
jgi:hypothetical protein